ncbi:MAG: hypothetical protein RLZZ01_589 [Actinomycetota bacterium]|jgi:AcrR family transcriptional regulator
MLGAAQGILTAEGLAACTVDEVARRSGVAKTTIYRHFGSADELAVAALEEMIADVVPPDLGSLRADLDAVVRSFRDLVPPETFRRLVASMLARALDDPEFAAVYQRTNETRHAALRIAIQRGMARGEVDPSIDLDLALHMVQGPFIAKRLIGDGDVSDRELAVLLDLIVAALAPAGRS